MDTRTTWASATWAATSCAGSGSGVWTSSIARAFKFGGTTDVELRWDIFNVFNTVNYALPENVIGGAGTDFGKITNTIGGPRVMQFGARFRF